MPEQPNIEYKQNWHDDYLKWVGGFSHARGGVLFIGKDDNGKVAGVADYKKPPTEISNKQYQELNKYRKINSDTRTTIYG